MEEVGVELDLLLVSAALDVDPPEHRVPLVLRLAPHPVEAPARRLGLEVARRAVVARQRERDLHLHDLALAQVLVAQEGAHPVTRELVDRAVGDLVADPAAHRVERRVDADVEVQLGVERGVAVAALADPALDRALPDARHVRVLHVRLAELAAEVDDDLGRAGLIERVAMDADALGRGQLGIDVIAVEVQPVIAGLRELGRVMLDVRLPARVTARLDHRRAARGHHLHARELPVVDVAEALDLILVAAVARAPDGVRARVRPQLHEPERLARGLEEEVAPDVGLHPRVHQPDVVARARGRRERQHERGHQQPDPSHRLPLSCGCA